MKKFLPIMSLVLLMAACSSKKDTAATQPAQPSVDTTGFAQYQMWKAQHELASPQDYEQQQQQQPQQQASAAPAERIKIIRVPVNHTTIVERRVSTPAPRATESIPVASTPTPAPAPVPVTIPTPESTAGTGSSTGGSGTGSGTDVGNTSPEPVKQKTGMSNKAKDAVIGGVIGGAAGAILTKKAGGAVIGAVLGAGGGWILGKKADQKQGRN